MLPLHTRVAWTFRNFICLWLGHKNRIFTTVTYVSGASEWVEEDWCWMCDRCLNAEKIGTCRVKPRPEGW